MIFPGKYLLAYQWNKNVLRQANIYLSKNSDEDKMLITHPTTTTNFGLWKHGIACVWTPLKNYDDQV